ncbi:hypothetical protein SH661x_002488 [Planctomicrobium sp. SH661]|uniref:hypothetical protein n=1 Tax=Planctomicrobium sp. SH661 TaxID=3448124 RepID=UPI003F5BE1B2
MTHSAQLRLGSILGFAFLVFQVGCGPSGPAIRGISGTATVGGKPLPEACVLTFAAENGNDTFITRTTQDGQYRYVPASALAISPGLYRVVVAPPGPKTVMINGMQSPDPSYKPDQQLIPKKYRSVETTPIEIKIGKEHVEFDVVLEP